MPKTLRSPRQRRLAELLVEHRQAAGLSQADLAARLGRYQSVVAAMEGGGRRIDVVELLDLAEAIGFDSTPPSPNSAPYRASSGGARHRLTRDARGRAPRADLLDRPLAAPARS